MINIGVTQRNHSTGYRRSGLLCATAWLYNVWCGISDPPTCAHTHAQPCNTDPPAFLEILSTHCAFLKSACLLALHTLSSVQLLLIFTVLTRLTSFYWLFSSLNSFHLHFAVFLSPYCKTRSNPFGTHIFPSGGGHIAPFPPNESSDLG